VRIDELELIRRRADEEPMGPIVRGDIRRLCDEVECLQRTNARISVAAEALARQQAIARRRERNSARKLRGSGGR